MKKSPVNRATLESVNSILNLELDRRLYEKGFGKFASIHESLGVITEEYYELIQAVTSNEVIQIESELYDIAVAALFAIASLHTED